MNFFKTLHLLCTSTNAFSPLLKTSVIRTIWHCFLLILLCPILIATVMLLKEKKECSQTIQDLDRASGGLYFCGDKMRLGQTTGEQHFTFTVNQTPARLDFVADPETVKKMQPNNWNENLGVILTPDRAFFWNRNQDFSYFVMELPALMLKVMLNQESTTDGTFYSDYMQSAFKNQALSAETLVTEVSQSFSVPETGSAANDAAAGTPPEKQQPVKVEPGIISRQILTILWFMAFAMYLMQCFSLVLLGGLCFSFVEYLHIRFMPVKLPYSRVLVLTLYAMFPGFVVATLFAAIGLEILSFQTTFFIVFFIYQLLSFRNLTRQLNPQPPAADDDF